MTREDRTEQCPFCGRTVRKTAMEDHLSSCREKQAMERVPGRMSDAIHENPGTDKRTTRRIVGEAGREYYCPDCSSLVTPAILQHQSREDGRWKTGTGLEAWVCPTCGYTADSTAWTDWADTILRWRREGKDAKLEKYGIE